MSTCLGVTREYNSEGYIVPQGGSQFFFPAYLDWMPIELKMVWFIKRGMGHPDTRYLLLESQGEQMLVPLNIPLKIMTLAQLKEASNGLEEYIAQYARENRISRVARNQ